MDNWLVVYILVVGVQALLGAALMIVGIADYRSSYRPGSREDRRAVLQGAGLLLLCPLAPLLALFYGVKGMVWLVHLALDEVSDLRKDRASDIQDRQ